MGSRKQNLQLWDRQPRESARAYTAFCTYRDLGAERSIDKAFRVGREQTVLRAPRRWFRWSQVFEWARRVKAWDDHLLSVNVAEKERPPSKKRKSGRSDGNSSGTASGASVKPSLTRPRPF
jgi:hypothetical protein